MSWIKLVIHPEHDKILRLADLTGASQEAVFASIVRWFRWVDEHADGPCPSVSVSGFRAISRWADGRLAEAMLDKDVDWMERDGDRLKPTRVDTHFGGGAKRRCTEASRKMSARNADKRPHNMRTECASEQSRAEQNNGARAPSSSAETKRPEGIDNATWEGIQHAERTRKRNAEAIARQNGTHP